MSTPKMEACQHLFPKMETVILDFSGKIRYDTIKQKGEQEQI